MPGRLMSKVYLARPVTLSGPSRRFTDVPRTDGFAGHAHFLASSLMGCSAGFCGSATRHPLCLQCRLEDANERATAADVAVQAFTDLLRRGVRMFFQKPDGCHDKTRCAEAAHHRVRVAKRLLDGMQLVAG